MYAKITNGKVDQFPYTVARLRHDNPNTSFPKHPTDELLASYGVMPVTVTNAPSYDERSQKLEQAAQPVHVNGAWLLQWNVSNKTAEEVAAQDAAKANSLRAERNAKLAACDWTQVADAPVDTAAWAVYRQELRDVPEQEGFPENIVWPTEPA